MVAALDDAVFAVTDHMEKLGLWDNTLFVFRAYFPKLPAAACGSRRIMVLTDCVCVFADADNGGNLGASGHNYPLRGGKYTLFEGGTRVSAFLSGGALPAAVRGTTSEMIIHEVDWLPTCVVTHHLCKDRPIKIPQLSDEKRNRFSHARNA